MQPTMRQLNKVQSFIFLMGGLLMVIGAGLSLVQGVSTWASVVRPYLFAVGAVCFSTMQMQQRYEGTGFTVRRLRRIMLLSDVLFLVTAVLMFASQGNLFGIDQITYIQYVYQKWVIVLLIAAVLQLYTSYRLDKELS